jgi:TatD DNase family protein
VKCVVRDCKPLGNITAKRRKFHKDHKHIYIMSDLFDAHCHLQFGLPTAMMSIPQLLTSRFGIASTNPQDWDQVNSLYEAFPPLNSKSSSPSSCDISPIDMNKEKEIYPAFGVHPWWSQSTKLEENMNWLEKLENILSRNEYAICGEIGLDKLVAKREEKNKKGSTDSHSDLSEGWEILYEHQKTIFKQQLELAARLKRPIVTHCVGKGSYGDMYDIFDSCKYNKTGEGEEGGGLPPRIYMHAYGGSMDFALRLLDMEKSKKTKIKTCKHSETNYDKIEVGCQFYFGFAAAINLKGNKNKFKNIISSIPDDRLLIESDSEEYYNQNKLLHDMLEVICDIKNKTKDEIIKMTTKNAMTFYGVV